MHLDEVRPPIVKSDAVVLSYLVSTNLRRHVRKLCDDQHPRFLCTGKDRTLLTRCIQHAALWAADKKQREKSNKAQS